MKKLKIYLDTSVISHLEQYENPEKREDTLKLWEDIKSGKYEVYISSTTEREIMDCKRPEKRITLANHLKDIKNVYKKIEVNRLVIALANEIIEKGVIKNRDYDDCTHIAAAVIADCNVIVSWNFKHIVNMKTILGIKKIIWSKLRKQVEICSPTVLIDKGEEKNE
jgi:predicted nucleic acid-binding protein